MKITLTDIRPPIWRRIQVPDCTLDKLHEHLQLAMGWMNGHLYEFELDGTRYGDSDMLCEEGEDIDIEDSRSIHLSQLLDGRQPEFSFRYLYDFGDGWEHQLVLEERLTCDPKAKCPVCLDGKRACPPEDCGGIGGYQHLLEVLANPKHKEYKELHQWAGDYKPEAFSTDEATHLMREGFAAWQLYDDVEI